MNQRARRDSTMSSLAVSQRCFIHLIAVLLPISADRVIYLSLASNCFLTSSKPMLPGGASPVAPKP